MRRAVKQRQEGIAAVEFALVAIIFFTVVFGAMELARAEYMLNTLREVTRRGASAAAKADFRDAAALQDIQAQAVFQNSAGGELPLGTPVTGDNVKIDYLSVSKADMSMVHMTALPSCPARNRMNCLADPYAANCIRFVRVRVCASMDGTGNCTPLDYKMLFPFLDLSGMKLPVSETIVPAGSLGYSVGQMPCP